MFLKHSGVKRRSGRYEWGSGENPYQHEPWFSWANDEEKLRKQGLADIDIAAALGMKTTELRQMRRLVKDEKKAIDSAWAYRLKEKGYSAGEIAKKMNLSEGTIRSYLNTHEAVKENAIKSTAEMLKSQVSKKKYLDVGEGVEMYLGVSKEKKNTALYLLKKEGYQVMYLPVEQQNNPGYFTSMKILCPPGTTYEDLHKHKDYISVIDERTVDNGKSWFDIKPPTNIDSNRIYIRYAEDGGKNKDGVIELRRGVEDIDLGGNHYAQVRIAVDGTHFMKGMALYSDDIPKGYDVVYNTNKAEGTDKYKVFKPQNVDPKTGEVDISNPFNAVLKEVTGQREYVGKDGKTHLSAINILKEEGDWENYKKTIASQMLSKQLPKVAKEQLDISYKDKLAEFDEIMSVTNPAVKQKLLAAFADDCDASAVHLKAASFPRQTSRVLLPLTDIKDNEVYAPGFNNGERVVLIRYPHGGKFEIPELVVNNRNKDGQKTISNSAKDAIGINANVAARLSGADFDGDTVLIIPNNSGRIKTSSPLKGLENYDPKESYPAYQGMPKVTKKNFDTQKEMGIISNLITDMTLKGAKDHELARAVRHSMTVIDAEKHNLDHKTSFVDNRILELKEKYQSSEEKSGYGASTLISRAKSPVYVTKRDLVVRWDPDTGEKIYKEAKDAHYTDYKTGKAKTRVEKSSQMVETKDARTLSSGTRMEELYADYANNLKGLANRARKAYLSIPNDPPSLSAAKTYSKEVTSLKDKLTEALKNAPLARKANLVASLVVEDKVRSNPHLDTKEEKRKLRSKALAAASARLGARRKENMVDITPKEWEAIQARAISNTMLKKILEYSDLDKVKEYATPRSSKAMTTGKISRAKSMLALGYTQAEVAERLGVSVSTLLNYV